jgi:hypothetical protein
MVLKVEFDRNLGATLLDAWIFRACKHLRDRVRNQRARADFKAADHGQ